VAGGHLTETDGITGLAFSPDGDEFAAAYNDSSVQVFDTATGQPAGDSFSDGAAAGALLALAFTQDGDLITVDATGSVTKWNPRASDGNNMVIPYTVNFPSQPGAVALSPDGQTLAAGYTSGAVYLWDIATNQQVGSPISTGDGDVVSLAFSADGTRLASAGDDGAVRLWDVSFLSPALDLTRLPG
jgi:WD40 repeat protein